MSACCEREAVIARGQSGLLFVPQSRLCRGERAYAARSQGAPLGRCNHETGAWKMHAYLADLTIAAPDYDLMDVRSDQFADDRIAPGIVRSHSNNLVRFPADG